MGRKELPQWSDRPPSLVGSGYGLVQPESSLSDFFVPPSMVGSIRREWASIEGAAGIGQSSLNGRIGGVAYPMRSSLIGRIGSDRARGGFLPRWSDVRAPWQQGTASGSRPGDTDAEGTGASAARGVHRWDRPPGGQACDPRSRQEVTDGPVSSLDEERGGTASDNGPYVTKSRVWPGNHVVSAGVVDWFNAWVSNQRIPGLFG